MTVQQSTLVITVNARNAQRDIERLDRSLLDLGTRGDRTARSMGSSMSSLTTYMAGVLTVATAISKVDAYTSMQNRLKLVTATQKELNQATNDTFAIAQRTAQAWEGVVQVYQRFADNAKVLGINLKQVASLTDTVSKSIAISGASAASAEAALVQFGQALASGVLRGEEFNSISEQAPALLKAIATGLSVNIGELRAMANQGKLTADVVIKALDKAKGSVDNLFGKTDFTIAQSFTQLNNATIKFVGEAGKANGAASLLSSSIRSLAENLDTIANIAVLGGVAFLTKAISTQVLATQAAIAATIARRASLVAEIEAQVQLAAVEVARTRQVTALALTEVSLARAEYNAALSAEARAAAIMRLTQAEIAHNLAINRNTAALAAQVSVQNTLNASTAVGSRIMGFLGGPVGLLTIAVTALAGGYLFMKNRTEEANQKLKEQMEIAAKTKDELLALQGVQKDVAVNELKDAFEKQNVSLRMLNNEYLGFIDNVGRSGKQSKAVYEIFELARKGAITNAEALERLNKLNVLTPEQKKQGLDLVNSYMLQAIETLKAEKALNVFGIQVKLSGNEAENAAQKVNLNSGSLEDNKAAADKATQAQKNYMDSLRQSALQTGLTNELISRGYGVDRAKQLSEAYIKGGNKINSETVKLVDENIAQNKKLKATEDAVADSKKANAKAARDAERERKKDAKQAVKDAKEQYQDRDDIAYSYATREQQIEKSLQTELKKIRESGFDSKNEQGFIANAKNRADLEKQLYIAQLSSDLNDWQDTEKEKLDRQVKINAIKINLDSQMNDEQKQQALDSLIDRSNFEFEQIKLSSKKRIFDATEFQYSEMDRIAERYKLEREEISKTHDLAERNILLQASLAKQNKEEADVKDQAITDYASVLGFEENPLIKQFEAIQKMRDLDLINEQAYQDAKLYIQSKSTTAYLDGMFGGFAALVDQNSKTYAVLFAAQKAFAVAQAVLNIPAAYSKAYDAVVGTPYVGPYIAPAIGAAAAALQVANAAQIKSTQMSGFESGGYTGNMGTKAVAGVVHGQEYVFNAKATKNIGKNNLESLAKTGELPNQQQAQPTTNIINVFDESELRNAMATPSGEKIIMNVIKRNRSKLGI